MAEVTVEREGRAEVVLRGGCLLCDGDLNVRFTPLGASSCCLRCRWLSQPKLEIERGSIKLLHTPAGQA